MAFIDARRAKNIGVVFYRSLIFERGVASRYQEKPRSIRHVPRAIARFACARRNAAQSGEGGGNVAASFTDEGVRSNDS
ncbi:hypothetical protein M2165_002982 [Variovorax sp. TBS-050B]|uniref:hypothetical protein n=1 Tax=Variovorax sp. TBS-050B TaxID=2940551 RepID=UPI002475B75D|nr:hypothetical protein [Variovorax sp. TBS-050B]MDH6593093.1 hypothetical protein [Variovorax sp. TBS-050B]